MEALGSKPKFWYRPDGTDVDWLFKYARENTGEHWAEKIAAEVAGLMGITHAEVELARFQESKGIVAKSFTSPGSELVHGNQILSEVVSDYDVSVTVRYSKHTLDNILLVIEPRAGEIAKHRFAEYLILDALIGNTDRHHENWGLQRQNLGGDWSSFIAPSFDHASSLGRELLDERRERLLRENRVGLYAENGHGGIFWLENESRGASPLELVRRAVREYPVLFQTSMRRLERANEDSLWEIVERVPDDWMSDYAREFAIVLMRYNLNELRKAFR